jgi:hypothetical protein
MADEPISVEGFLCRACRKYHDDHEDARYCCDPDRRQIDEAGQECRLCWREIIGTITTPAQALEFLSEMRRVRDRFVPPTVDS